MLSGPLTGTSLTDWLDGRRRSCDMAIRQIPWDESREWIVEPKRIRHVSDAFFSIVGRGAAGVSDVNQPLIDQPEVGILGMLVRRDNGTPHLLVQAKAEPGNIGFVQAAPTVQATESNYLRRHHGRATALLEHFRDAPKARVLSDSLQSEQGTRFLDKYNRNMVVAVDGESIDEFAALRWAPFTEILPLLLQDFQINTDARSVLASGPWRQFALSGVPFGRWRGKGGLGEALLLSYEMRFGAALAHLERLRHDQARSTIALGLDELTDWEMTDTALRSTRDAGFELRAYMVTSTEREVDAWDQPFVVSTKEQRIALLCQEWDGLLHFAFRGRPEIGFRNVVQFGPTYLNDETPTDAVALLSMRQSDEGGRFFRDVSRYEVVQSGDEAGSDDIAWMTLGEIEANVRRPGVFNNEARSLISMLLAFL